MPIRCSARTPRPTCRTGDLTVQLATNDRFFQTGAHNTRGHGL
jgi:hypothetical protein